MKIKPYISFLLTAAVLLPLICVPSAAETGWTSSGNRFEYVFPSGKKAENGLHRINSVLYKFENGQCIKKYSGISKTKGISRRYKDGLPYTGWLKNSAGKKYCIDGYYLKGEQQIGNYIYDFGDEGIYTGGRKKAEASVNCGEYVTLDTERLTVAFTANTLDCEAMQPYKMDRFVQGEWIDCARNDGDVYQTNDALEYVEKGGVSTELSFDPEAYSGKALESGFYRIAVDYYNTDGAKKTVYSVFEAVPPVSVRPARDVFYYNGREAQQAILNCKVISPLIDLKSIDFTDIECELYKINSGEQKLIKEPETGFGTPDKETGEFEVQFFSINETGSYKAVTGVKGKKAETYFYVDNMLEVTPLHEEYNINDPDLIIDFDVYNKSPEPVEIDRVTFWIYHDVEGKTIGLESDVDIDIDIISETLEPGQHTTVKCNPHILYDVPSLEPGIYSVFIWNYGKADFILTDKK